MVSDYCPPWTPSTPGEFLARPPVTDLGFNVFPASHNVYEWTHSFMKSSQTQPHCLFILYFAKGAEEINVVACQHEHIDN